MNAPWTLPELTHRIDAILRSEGITQQNGQVAEAPNGRAIRWYQSTGLLRRPVQRGRTAYYGPLHLAEVVAIKRLQADGLSLADVQTRLQSLDDVALQALAALPPSPALFADAIEIAHRQGQPFWSASFDDGNIGDNTSDDDGDNTSDDDGNNTSDDDDAKDHGAIATNVLATRRTVDHPSGVSITLPATISDDVARRFLARLVDDLAAESLLSTSTAPTSARSVRSDQPDQTPSPEDDQ